jgi:Holliday junction resolvase RusA-like endonuclease
MQIPLLRECGALVVSTGAPFCCFELSGAPRGKALKIATIRLRNGRVFSKPVNTSKTESYMDDLKRAAARAMGNKFPTRAPVQVTLHAYFPIPPSWPMRDREDARMGARRPTGKPDADNIAKVGLDSLTKIVWFDDAPVVDVRVLKFYSDEPGLRVEVRELVPPQ